MCTEWMRFIDGYFLTHWVRTLAFGTCLSLPLSIHHVAYRGLIPLYSRLIVQDTMHYITTDRLSFKRDGYHPSSSDDGPSKRNPIKTKTIFLRRDGTIEFVRTGFALTWFALTSRIRACHSLSSLLPAVIFLRHFVGKNSIISASDMRPQLTPCNAMRA